MLVPNTNTRARCTGDDDLLTYLLLSVVKKKNFFSVVSGGEAISDAQFRGQGRLVLERVATMSAARGGARARSAQRAHRTAATRVRL